jgi:Na+/melibiose symporter-like transporter
MQVRSKVRRRQLIERDEKDQSWIVLVVILVLVIVFLWVCFEDVDENEDESHRPHQGHISLVQPLMQMYRAAALGEKTH